MLVSALSSMGWSWQPCYLQRVDYTEPSMPFVDSPQRGLAVSEYRGRWRFSSAFTYPSKSLACWAVDITSCVEPTHWRAESSFSTDDLWPKSRRALINSSFSTLSVGIGEETQPREEKVPPRKHVLKAWNKLRKRAGKIMPKASTPSILRIFLGFEWFYFVITYLSQGSKLI